MTFFRGTSDTKNADDPRQAAVLARSTMRAADELGVSQTSLASILGVSESTVSRIRKGSLTPVRDRGKTFELEALFVRFYVSLDVAVHGDKLAAERWLKSYNEAFRARPLDLLKSIRGLIAVTQYLDHKNGRL